MPDRRRKSATAKSPLRVCLLARLVLRGHLAGDGLVVSGLPVEKEFTDRPQFLLEGVPVCIACVRTEHAVRESSEAEGHLQGVGNGQAGRELKFFQVGHRRPAVKAYG